MMKINPNAAQYLVLFFVGVLISCSNNLVTNKSSQSAQKKEVSTLSTIEPSEETVETDSNMSELRICLNEAPSTLYKFDTEKYVENLILETIYGGSVYDEERTLFYPSVLDRFPTIANGDVQIVQKLVITGDEVYDPDQKKSVMFNGSDTMMNQLIVTFTLNSESTWSDGKSVIAEDSFFAFGLKSSLSKDDNFEWTDSYETINSHQIQWVGIPNYLTHDYLRHFVLPLPKHTMENFDPNELLATNQSNYYPMGWGPYMVTEWNENEIILNKNPFYKKASLDIDRVIFTYGQDWPKQFTGLVIQRGTDEFFCDLYIEHQYEDKGVDSNLAQLVESPLIHPYVYPIAWEHMDFIFTDTNGIPTIFADKWMREVVAYSIQEPRSFVDSGKRLFPMSTFLPERHVWAIENGITETYSYNPIKSMNFLESKGWIDEDGDGVREKDGKELYVRLGFLGDYAMQIGFAPHIQAQLNEIGMKVVLYQLDIQEMDRLLQGDSSLTDSLDLILYPSPITNIPQCDLFISSETGGQLLEPQKVGEIFSLRGITSLTGYDNPLYDEACRLAQTTVDWQELPMRYAQVQQIFVEDLPSIPFFVRTAIVYSRPELQGLQPNGVIPLTWNIEEWSMP